MKAKDTEYICDNYGHTCQQLKDEAEISFKAALEEVGKWLKDKHLTPVYDAFVRRFKV